MFLVQKLNSIDRARVLRSRQVEAGVARDFHRGARELVEAAVLRNARRAHLAALDVLAEDPRGSAAIALQARDAQHAVKRFWPESKINVFGFALSRFPEEIV